MTTQHHNKTTQTNGHAVILLAAGLSQRLGTPKQLLLRARLPLITHMLYIALKSGAKKIIVVVPSDLPAVTTAVQSMKIPSNQLIVVQNDQSGLGMAHSLQLGIEALRIHAPECGRVLIMGVDQIHLDSAHVTDLLAAVQPIAVSQYPASDTSSEDKQILGLPVVVEQAQLLAWYAKLSGDKGLRALIRHTDITPHIVDNPKLSTDIDTPAQLASAKACGWLDA